MSGFIRKNLYQGKGLLLTLLFGLPFGWADPGLVEQARQATTRAVDFLAQVQQPDGSFLIYQCRDQALTDCTPWYSPTSMRDTPSSPALTSLPTVTVLTGLLAVEDPRATPLLEKGARFLQAQMDERGWFGYFRMVAPLVGPQCPGEFRALHTTVINRMVLETLGVSLPLILPQLLTYQRPRDGTFYHYLIPPAEVAAIKAGGPAQERFRQRYGPLMRDHGDRVLENMNLIDPVINANVFNYLVQHAHISETLCDYLVRTSKEAKEQEHMHVYPKVVTSPYEFWYVVSQGYSNGATCLEPAKAALVPRLLRQQRLDGSWGSVNDTALATSSLMHFGYAGDALDHAVQFLLSQQQPNGSWKRSLEWGEALWLWYGSQEVSTGYVLETLGHYLKLRHTTSL